MNQVEEIVNAYYNSIKLKPLLGFKKRSLTAVTELIENGILASRIQSTLQYYVDNYEKYSDKPCINLSTVFCIDEIDNMLRSTDDNSVNLIDSARFYYHKRLRIAPKAPKVVVDDEGNCTTIVEPFFLEMIKTFTLHDLLEYFYDVHNVDKLARREKRDMAAMKYIVDTYRDCSIEVNWLDLILYLIDVSRQIIIDEDLRPLTNVLHIQDYEEQALDLLEDKMNYERVNGVDKIVPRKTMDSGNGWTK